jgi:hypothetical protein
MDVNLEMTTSQDIIQIGTMDIPVEKDSKRPVVLNNQVGTSAQKGSVATSDHEASGSGPNSKYFLPRWCPPGLTHTQRRKLQRLRLWEKEKELEEQRDKIFNSYRPMVPQGKEWRAKMTPQAGAVKLPEVAVKPPEAVKPVDQAVRPGSPEMSPILLLQSPWLMMISCRRYLLQKTTSNLLITVLLQSAWILKTIEKAWPISMRIALRTKWPVESVSPTLELFFSTQALLKTGGIC